MRHIAGDIHRVCASDGAVVLCCRESRQHISRDSRVQNPVVQVGKPVLEYHSHSGSRNGVALAGVVRLPVIGIHLIGVSCVAGKARVIVGCAGSGADLRAIAVDAIAYHSDVVGRCVPGQ